MDANQEAMAATAAIIDQAAETIQQEMAEARAVSLSRMLGITLRQARAAGEAIEGNIEALAQHNQMTVPQFLASCSTTFMNMLIGFQAGTICQRDKMKDLDPATGEPLQKENSNDGQARGVEER